VLFYGKTGKHHVGELVSHLHLQNKARLSLTDEMDFNGFVDWLKANIKPKLDAP
jgi:hypothetical protein